MKASRITYPFRLKGTALAGLAYIAAGGTLIPQHALAQDLPASTPAAVEAPIKSLGVVTVIGGWPTSLPTQIPTTIEGITREQIEQTINAADSGDALKYLPSLLVRKRYIGDYNHAVLSTRASGTGNPARSMVYADGILLSNYLGNGPTNTPRWGLVTPEEIERLDVLYGPFSAAYPGNSVGAVVDYVTRMPTRLEAHAKVGAFGQSFKLYGTDRNFDGNQASASLGNRTGDWSWFVNVNRTKSIGQPLTFALKPVSTVVSAASPVSGAVPVLDRTNAPSVILGAGTQYETLQEHLKIKVAYDFSSTVRANYTMGYWQNTAENRSESYLRNAAGAPVYSGNVSINGRGYTLAASDFGVSNESFEHLMHGLSLKSNTKGVWDWEVAASLYDFRKDQIRSATTFQPGALNGGAGILQDQNRTGWNTLALKGIWRPTGIQGAHIADFGYQQGSYKLRVLRSHIAANWKTDDPSTLANDVGGNTRLRSVYAQDTWRFAPLWKTVLGARVENWNASNGFTTFGPVNPANASYASRSETNVSPKAALSYQWASDTVLKASTGRAVRFPTVGDLYGATNTVNARFVNDPNLKPEKSWTTELSAEKDLGHGLFRFTFFNENVRDSLFTQLTLHPILNQNISRVANVKRVQTNGVEVAYNGDDVFRKGLDLSGSVTYADSRIKENEGFVAVAATPSASTSHGCLSCGRRHLSVTGSTRPGRPAWVRATADGNIRRSTTLTSMASPTRGPASISLRMYGFATRSASSGAQR